MAQLTALQKAHEELCAELQKAEDDYNMATGTMGEIFPKADNCTRDQVHLLETVYLEKKSGLHPRKGKNFLRSESETPRILKSLSLLPWKGMRKSCSKA